MINISQQLNFNVQHQPIHTTPNDNLRCILENLKMLLDQSACCLQDLQNGNTAKNPIAAGETARIWGDPHVVDADGGKFDVMGKAGKYFNLFNDQGISLNGKFEAAGKDVTVIGSSGLTLGKGTQQSIIQFSARPQAQATLNGEVIKINATQELPDGSLISLSKDGRTLTVKTPEGYTITQNVAKEGSNGELDITIKSGNNGVGSDGILPGGILGETFDADTLMRNSQDKQGRGALNQDVSNYAVNHLFASPHPNIAPSFSGTNQLIELLQSLGINTQSLAFPNTSPLTEQPIDWAQEINDTLSRFNHCSKNKVIEDSKENDRLFKLMMAALSSGNVNMAMLLFSHLETKTANSMTKALMGRMQGMQERKRSLIDQIQKTGNDADGAKQLQVINQELGTVNDDMNMLQSFMKEVMQNKNQAVEFASNFTSSENQTTMNVIRSMRG